MKIITAERPGTNVTQAVVRLRGFHNLMSLVGAIGSLMDGSGLKQIFEFIYASDTAPHLLCNKAISQAL